MPRYALSSYDDNLCLKPPLLLWVVALYLSRAITLPLAKGIGSVAGMNAAAANVLQGLWSVETLFPSLIAAAVLYAMCRRLPNASKPVRWVWAHGRVLLALSALIDCTLLVIPAVRAGEMNDQTLPSLCAAGLDLYFLTYVLVDKRVRDAFADFPLLLTSR
ncbi:MAG TPA: DUF2919 family protein [Steroidobacteraceae bacterium]|nr:DUF2919 family protein [Steroidobacteraceae bacterium]